MTTYISYEWNNSSNTWDGSEYQSITWSGNTITDVATKEWNNGWVNKDHGSITYDGSGNPTEAKIYDWTGSAYESDYSHHITWNGSSSIRNAGSSQAVVGVYPNPCNDVLFISNVSKGSYSIMDLNGRMMGSGSITGNGIDVSEIPAGVYMISVSTDSNLQRIKFVKE
jgi:hypothetical protein